MFHKKYIILYCCIFFGIVGSAQQRSDSAVNDQDLAIDTSLNYDDILNDLGDFLDSLLAPRSYFIVNVSAANRYFNYKNNTGTKVDSKNRPVVSPTLGYYHKSGPGITASGSITYYGKKYDLYQYSISPSFDFIQSRKFIGGISYTRYFTRDSLPFYTTPLVNEADGYFLWRKSWVQPGVAVSYGWGSRSEVKKREGYIRLLRRLIPAGSTTSTDESIADFSVTASLRHTFYWLDLSKHRDYIRLTPVLAFSSGTQKYGFNQASGIYAMNIRNSDVIQYNTGNVNLDNKLEFQPLSLTLYLRPEYSIGKFFVQPQFILDYYFPAEDNNLTTVFSVNAGFMF